jgi:hypothetical protein
MRNLLVVCALVLCLPSLSDARKPKGQRKSDPRLAYVDDEPMSHHVLEPSRAPSDVGARREITIDTPAPAPVADTGAAVERVASAEDPMAGRAKNVDSLSGASDELAFRRAERLRKQQSRR